MNEEKILIYVDESGIHKMTGYSCFMFIYVNSVDKKMIKNEILKIEKFLKIPPFHWSDFSSKKGWNVRKRFVQMTVKLPFQFKYKLLSNPIHSNNELHNSLFNLLNEDIIQEINIDGKQPQWFEAKLKRSLRDRGFSVQKIKTVNDKNEPIIRLADALANMVRIYHDNPQDLIVELFNNLSKKNITKPLCTKVQRIPATP